MPSFCQTNGTTDITPSTRSGTPPKDCAWGRCEMVMATTTSFSLAPMEWRWYEGYPKLNFKIVPPDGPPTRETAVAISVSESVLEQEVVSAIGDVPYYHVRVGKPGLDMVRSASDLVSFRKCWRDLLTMIRNHHGPSTVVHLFPAVPNSIGIEMGRVTLPKSHPEFKVWDHQRDKGGYIFSFSV